MQQIIKSSNPADDLQKIVSEIKHDKLFVLTDEHTQKFCLPLLWPVRAVEEAGQIVTPSDDGNKSMESLAKIWWYLSQNGATRHSLLINLGGGMVTDIGGFAAATFKRGINYINIPTTLLGAVDAAVGGKTGINFAGLKNEIGAFYPAKYVLISSRFFKTLRSNDLLSGFAEMLKHALIHSQTEWEKLLAFDIRNIDYEWLNEAVYRSVSIKEAVVKKDPFERNIRKSLNLGHTVGHAFESFAMKTGKPVPHGYAVAWGLITELYLAHRICGFPKEKLRETVRFVQSNYGALPLTCNDYEELYRIMKHDKKNENQVVNFTLPADVGDVRINQTADKELIFQALDFYRDSVGL